MAYTRPTLSELYARIKADAEARLTSGVKIAPTSLWGVFSTVIAGASYLVYGFLDWISRQQFVDTADETGLTRWGNIYGLPRKAPVYASGEVAFTGTAATVVPSGTQIQSSEGAIYTTADDFMIGTTVSVEAEAVDAGAAGNTTDAELSLVSPLSGVDTDVPVISGFDEGQDLETVEDWTVRILQRIQNPPASGNVGDYERWALTQAGVSFAWCFAAADWAGPGTVGLAISGPNFASIDPPEVADVQTYIDSVRPVPALVTVYSPTPVVVDMDISITPNTSTTRAAVTSAIEELYNADAAPGATMLISRLRAACVTVGVSDADVTDIQLDAVSQGAVNYTVTKLQVPQLGTITFSTLV